MRPLFYILSVLGVMGLAVWAYQQNYAAQTELKRVDRLHRDIAVARERLAVLRAEWAYLTAPTGCAILRRSTLTGCGCCR